MLTAGVLLITLCLIGVHCDETNDRIVDTNQNEENDQNDWFDLLDDIESCVLNPCLNGGLCQIGTDATVSCRCQEPFAGKRCQTVKNVCKNVTCGHGDCVINFMNPLFYECKCHAPYQGPDCSTKPPSPCDPDPCQNGGTCAVENEGFSCTCPSGYTGRFCQSAPNDCYEGRGESYRGSVSITEDDVECLSWNSYFILQTERNPFTMFNFTEEENNNHCRNPDGDLRPWCYIKNNNTLDWNYCKVKKCSGDPTPSPTPVQPEPEPSQFSQCGKLSPNILSSIVKGSVASRGHHPWQASVQIRNKGSQSGFSHYCGGTLISSCWVLTAAHCISPDYEYQVMLGGMNIDKHEDYEQIIPVIETIVHENYRPTMIALYNDTALLKLQKTEGDMCAKETDFVRTACLPDKTFPPKTQCVVSGWGETRERAFWEPSTSSPKLLKAKVLLISESKCNQTNVYHTLLDDSMLCAGYLGGGIDSCQGDSGGPLACKHNSTQYVSGVVSWGIGCARKNKPGVYANVYGFVEWIRSKMN